MIEKQPEDMANFVDEERRSCWYVTRDKRDTFEKRDFGRFDVTRQM